jgi:hypothetical protein
MSASIHRLPRAVALGAAAIVSLAGCAPLTVSTAVERGVDLSAYRTYAWSTQVAPPTGDPRLDGNSIFHDYLAAAIDRRLTAGGLEPRDTAPDLLVRYFAGVSQEVFTTGAEPDGSCRDCRLEVYDGGTLVIDLVDARTRTLVWRGWAKGDIDGVVDDQELMERRIDRAVERIFERLRRQ